jgi:hypothetical protein
VTIESEDTTAPILKNLMMTPPTKCLGATNAKLCELITTGTAYMIAQ